MTENIDHFLSIEKFVKNERLGKGTFGEVFKITNKETGEIYAAKIGFLPLDQESLDDKINLSREVNLLAKLNHPSILKFIGFCPYNFEKKNKPIIVTEYSSNGSLLDILELERLSRALDAWDATKKLVNIYGIAHAMSYLHSHNIIHRDLKPENILENEYLFPKISDFGFSKVYHENQESMTLQSTVGFKGSPMYIAPEIWCNNQYSKEGDVYAFSFILYEIITNERPYHESSAFSIAIDVVQNKKRPPFKYEIQQCYRSLIERCWSQDPTQRPSFDQIVDELKNNPAFLEGVDENDFFDYVDYLDNAQNSFDQEKIIINLEKLLSNRKSGLLRKTLIKHANAKHKENEVKKENNKPKQNKTFYDEVISSPEFHLMDLEGQAFFEYSMDHTTNDKTIKLSQNNLSALSKILNSPNFIKVLDKFEDICVEMKYPSHNFENIFHSITNMKNNHFQNMNVDLIISKTNFILETNKTINNLSFSSYVRTICASSFNGCETIKEIVFPSSLTKIDELAFCGCISLDNLIIPSNVETIGLGAFKGCLSLHQITLNPNKTAVDFTAFQDCVKLHTLVLTSEGTTIESFRDEPFKSIEKIVISPPISIIADETFKRFDNIKEIELPSSVIKIGYNSFGGCLALKKINLPEMKSLNRLAFYNCTSLQAISFPSSLMKIDSYSLFGCSTLTRIDLPDTVASIDQFAFADCTSLQHITLSSSLIIIKEAAFKNCINLEELKLPERLNYIGNRAFENCSKLQIITIPKSVQNFGEYAFSNCSSLKEVQNLENTTLFSIPGGFFNKCPSLTTINLEFINVIGENSFRGCSSLSINFPKYIKIFEENSFSECSSLTEIIIPQFVSSINESAFKDCISLEKVSFLTESLASIDDHVFEGCVKLKDIKLPKSISTIGKYAFKGCTSLSEVQLPSSVYSIGAKAFKNCSSLTLFEMPPNIDIGDCCFEGCNLLDNIPQ